MRKTISVAFALPVLVLAAAFPLRPGGAQAVAADDPYVVAGGDIGCGDPSVAYPDGETYVRSPDSCHEDATAAMFAPGGSLAGPSLRAVLPLGDLQYPSGALETFTYANSDCSIVPPYGTGPCSFDQSWRVAGADSNVPIHPTPGNHDYALDSQGCKLSSTVPYGRPYGACGYNAYWGNRIAAPRPSRGGDGKGSYIVRYDTASPHPMLFVSLNVGQCELNDGKCAATSSMVAWAEKTLADPGVNPPGGCVVVYWHQAAFDYFDHGTLFDIRPVWQALLAPSIDRRQRPDLVLNGHDHVYERFEPLDANGHPGTGSPSIPEIVVGTAGRDIGAVPQQPPPIHSGPPAASDLTNFGLEKISWSSDAGRIDAAFYHADDGAPFDPVSYRCNGAGVTGTP